VAEREEDADRGQPLAARSGARRQGCARTTLHGLRVSYAAWWKRNGSTDAEVAALIGDVSEKMGKHYTRHVDAEIVIDRAFERVKNGKT
jgi:integrase